MKRHLAVIAGFALALAGCGFGPGQAREGKVQLSVTRDFGKTTLRSASQPKVRSSDTVMRLLQKHAKITTRYGGAFVQSIDGIAGNESGGRHDWFYFVNGMEAPRGAAEYRLHDGDVLWWDYRDWGRRGQSVPVVVGAFPEPFVHGFGGKTRDTIVLGPRTPVVRRIARLVHAKQVVPAETVRVSSSVNTLTIVPSKETRFFAEKHGDAVSFTYYGDPRRLLEPSFYRHRYRIP
jgi:hypothetical protein